MFAPKSCSAVEPLGSFISYKLFAVENPKASTAPVVKSPKSKSTSLVGSCVNVEFVNPKSAVKATVPLSFLNVIVLSAVGFDTTNVVSALSSDVPSKDRNCSEI